MKIKNDSLSEYLYPSSANKNPTGQAHSGNPLYVVMHCFSHLSSAVHFLFVGHFSSSSPLGQSFIPSQTCFLFTQFLNALLRRCSCVLHMYWSSSQKTWQFISSSPLVQSRTPSHSQVFCGFKYLLLIYTLDSWNLDYYKYLYRYK